MDSKEKILNAALNLFITNGFDGTSATKIVKESGYLMAHSFIIIKSKKI